MFCIFFYETYQKMLYQLEGLVCGDVVKRPSKLIKTPYVADVLLKDKEILGHSPALGCGGLADVGSRIYMVPTQPKSKCDYTLYLSEYTDKDHPNEKVMVGIHPKMAEQLMEISLKENKLTRLPNVKFYRRETMLQIPNFVNSRFDFTGLDENGNHFILEVKNVPLADYEDLPAKDRKNKSYENRNFNDKVAYFPDGYRKKTTDPISPRALKHVQELTKIRKYSNVRCLLGFVIQRDDVSSFQASVIDPQYREAIQQAISTGVEIFALVIKWTENGDAYFVTDNLPVL